MVFSKHFGIPLIHTFVLVIFLFYTCSVRSQSTDTSTSDSTSDSSSDPQSSGSTTISSSISTNTRTEETSASTATTISDSTETTNTTDFTETTDTTDYTQTTNTIDSTETPNATDSSNITTTTSSGCYPDGFPFFNDCISPTTNGIIVIVAFSLSILSFIGVIGVASYMLFCRKYFSAKKSRLMTNYNVSQQGMKSSTTNDLTHSKASSSNQRRDASRKKKLNNNAVRLQSTPMKEYRRAQQPPLDRSKPNQQKKKVPMNHSNLD